jgi:hypothetical protein
MFVNLVFVWLFLACWNVPNILWCWINIICIIFPNRIPSNPSVTSKSSAGKLSTGSIERTSERGSPMPTFHVEVLSPGHRENKRNSLPDYCFSQKWVNHTNSYIPHSLFLCSNFPVNLTPKIRHITFVDHNFNMLVQTWIYKVQLKL